MGYRILTLNNISVRGLERLPRERYELASEIGNPHAVLLRSADMHGHERSAASVLAVARAGAGTNNIPVAALALWRAGLRAACGRQRRQGAGAGGAVPGGAQYLPGLGIRARATRHGRGYRYSGGAGQGRFCRVRIAGRTLGVIGLGAVGVQVCNSAEALGMKVLGYDPQITVATRLAAVFLGAAGAVAG